MDLLAGCPYSLPDSSDVIEQVEKLRETEANVRTRIRSAAAKLAQAGAFREFYSGQRTREIYESNAIEGLGPSLQRTALILASPQAEQVSNAITILTDDLFIRTVQSDPHVVEVLGLHGAKVLAETLLDELKKGGRLTEYDLRSMHALIASGEVYAGRYKRWHVRIGGKGTHEPHLPIDTPGAMHIFIEWLGSSRELPPTLRAAIAHAWLTHIHPFEDGNGRVARILANLLLNREQLPPAIVRHSSQRNEYITALAHSDEAGDIMPLAGVFTETMKRFAREIEKPKNLRRILQDEIARESSTVFDAWLRRLNDFTARLFGELRLRKIEVRDIATLDPESFGFLTERDPAGATWLYTLHSDDLKLLVWLGYASDAMYSQIDSLVRHPSLFFSVPADRYSLKPYRSAHPAEAGGVSEVYILPATPPSVYAIIDQRVKVGGIVDAANDIANRISAGFSLRRSRGERGS